MLDRAWLADRLAPFPQQTIARQGLRQAAVLVPLYERCGEDYLLFTERTDHLHHHAGEISFPGGGRDDSDPDLLFTACRETEEELGIASEQIRILGRLDDFYSIHGYHVVPYVGTIPQPDDLSLDAFEIARVFETPLEHFRDPQVHHIEDWTHRGRTMPVDFYRYGEDVIWGLTAAILKQLLQITAPLAPGGRTGRMNPRP